MLFKNYNTNKNSEPPSSTYDFSPRVKLIKHTALQKLKLGNKHTKNWNMQFSWKKSKSIIINPPIVWLKVWRMFERSWKSKIWVFDMLDFTVGMNGVIKICHFSKRFIKLHHCLRLANQSNTKLWNQMNRYKYHFSLFFFFMKTWCYKIAYILQYTFSWSPSLGLGIGRTHLKSSIHITLKSNNVCDVQLPKPIIFWE